MIFLKKIWGKILIFFLILSGNTVTILNIIKDFGLKYAFGNILRDGCKDFYELPRYPINEKYGEIKRSKSLTKTLPFKFKKFFEEKYLLQAKNPPNVTIEFYNNIKNLKSVGCYSNEGGKWRQSILNSKTQYTFNKYNGKICRRKRKD